MSAQEENTAIEPEVFDAVLVRGKSYTYKGAVFKAGEPRKVSLDTKEYLEEYAYDDVAVATGNGDEMEIDRRGKFEFQKSGVPKPAATVRARKRS